jgi:hypothetical protein
VASWCSRGVRAACLVAGTALAVSACAGGSSRPDRSPSTTSPEALSAGSGTTAPPSASSPQAGSPSASGSPDVRAIAVNVYLAMWADMVEAARTSNYASPRLADHAASQALQLLSGALRRAHDRQLVAQGTPRFSPQVTGVTPPEHPVAVSLRDCMDGTTWLNYRRDGQLQNDQPGGRHRATATVGFLDGRWLVTHLQIGEVGTCS